MAMLTLMGLYNYDSTLFDSMVIPTGLNRQQVINNIVLETAELEVVYPSPGFMKTAINLWSNTRLFTWERIYRTSLLEYNPIENYNRTETETTENSRQHSGSDTTTNTRLHSGTDTTSNTSQHSGSDTTTNTSQHSGSDTTTNTRQHSGADTTAETTSNEGTASGTSTTTNSGGPTKTTTNEIAAYDSASLVTHDKSTETTIINDTSAVSTETESSEDGTRNSTLTHGEKIADSGSVTHGEKIEDSGSVTHGEKIQDSGSVTHGEQIADSGSFTHGEKIVDAFSRESHVSGNIGVTTSQQMAISELEVAEKFNVIDYITQDFKRRFCVLVY